MEEFDCIEGLGQIEQLVRDIPLKAIQHEHLNIACDMIRQRLKRCDELEADEAKKE